MRSTVDACSLHVNLVPKGLKFLDEYYTFIGGEKVIPRDSGKESKAKNPSKQNLKQTKKPNPELNKQTKLNKKNPERVVIEVASLV